MSSIGTVLNSYFPLDLPLLARSHHQPVFQTGPARASRIVLGLQRADARKKTGIEGTVPLHSASEDLTEMGGCCNIRKTMHLDRRSFLQFGTVLPLDASTGPSSTKPLDDLASAPLPEIPSLSDLASDRMVHHLHEYFNPPGLQNEWGHAQAAKSVSGITAITFPPYVCCGQPAAPFSPGFIPTCEMVINGRLSVADPLPGGKVAYQWFPHCVLREAEVDGIRISTRAFLPSRRMAVAQSITLENLSRARRSLTLEFILRAHVGKQPRTGPGPGDADEFMTPLAEKGCVVFRSRDGKTFSVRIPAGVRSGTKLRLREMGMATAEDPLRKGDVYLELHVA